MPETSEVLLINGKPIGFFGGANQVFSTSIKEIKVVSELPADAASHTDTLYLIPEA